MFATAVRLLAKKAKKNVRKPADMNIGYEGEQWSGTLREIAKEKGPLTVAGFWEHAQMTGMRSKRHMKIVLRWMVGQNHVKLVCNHIGDRRSPADIEFLYKYVTPRRERVPAEGSEAATDRTSDGNRGDFKPGTNTGLYSSLSSSSDEDRPSRSRDQIPPFTRY